MPLQSSHFKISPAVPDRKGQLRPKLPPFGQYYPFRSLGFRTKNGGRKSFDWSLPTASSWLLTLLRTSVVLINGYRCCRPSCLNSLACRHDSAGLAKFSTAFCRSLLARFPACNNVLRYHQLPIFLHSWQSTAEREWCCQFANQYSGIRDWRTGDVCVWRMGHLARNCVSSNPYFFFSRIMCRIKLCIIFNVYWGNKEWSEPRKL